MKQFYTLVFVLLVLGITSCRDSDRDEDTTTNSSEDYATGQTIIHDIFKIVHQAAYSSKGITTANLADTNTIFGCDTLIIDTISNPKKITVQFDNPCSFNYVSRSGTIIITTSSKYDTPGASTSVNFSNYNYNNYSILSGTVSVVYNGIVDGKPNYSFNTNELRIENNRKRSIYIQNTQRFSIQAGETTATFVDDTYSISGTTNGTTFEGNSFTATITTNLTLLGSCRWINSGLVNVSPNNKPVRKLNFGSSCDNKASVSIYDITHDIALP
ncbi:MAG: hypothetical protein J5I47_01205 [Vicingus serpentipes]|nr:hypothetical protein [Vicingus serpentipes]